MMSVHDAIMELERHRVQENIERESIEFVTTQMKKSVDARVLEIGTFNGYSALWLSLHAKEVISIEVDEGRYREAVINLKPAKNVHIVHGHALDAIPAIPGSFDVVLIDAMKREYHEYLALILDKIVPGGLIFVDNTISHRERLDAFFDYLEEQCLEWEELGLGKGLVRIKA